MYILIKFFSLSQILIKSGIKVNTKNKEFIVLARKNYIIHFYYSKNNNNIAWFNFQYMRVGWYTH